MKKIVLVGLAAAAVLAVGTLAVVLSGPPATAEGNYTFETASVQRGDVSRVVSASGAVQPREKVEVGSEVSGKITAIYVDFNDAVKRIRSSHRSILKPSRTPFPRLRRA